MRKTPLHRRRLAMGTYLDQENKCKCIIGFGVGRDVVNITKKDMSVEVLALPMDLIDFILDKIDLDIVDIQHLQTLNDNFSGSPSARWDYMFQHVKGFYRHELSKTI